jgi:hypothetical protein
MDVCDGQFGVPPVIKVHSKWPKTQVLHQIGDISAVGSPANAYEAIVRLAVTLALELLHPRLKEGATLFATDNSGAH